MKSEDTKNKKRSRRQFLTESAVVAGLAAGMVESLSGQTPERAAFAKPVRRVVTGTNAEGKSAVIFDGAPPTVFGSNQLIWFTDSSPVDNSGNKDATVGAKASVMNPGGTGTVFRVESFPVGFGMHCKDACTQNTDLEGQPGDTLHANKNIAYNVILNGELNHVSGDGKETNLKAGDIIVMRGTVHRWINRGNQPAQMIVILIPGTAQSA